MYCVCQSERLWFKRHGESEFQALGVGLGEGYSESGVNKQHARDIAEQNNTPLVEVVLIIHITKRYCKPKYFSGQNITVFCSNKHYF